MNEQFEKEEGPAPENLEKQKYKEWQAAQDEEDQIIAEIDKVFADTPNRVEAEKIVLEKWAPLMDEARKKSSEARKAWLDTMYRACERERKELDDKKFN